MIHKLLFLLLAFNFTSVFSEERINLFLHSSNKNDLTPKQEKILEYIKSQKMNLKISTVEINSEAFSAPQLMLNISPTVSMVAETKNLDTVRETVQWQGNITNSPDSVNFIVHGENITGTIQNKDHMFSVKPIGGGLHVIIEQSTEGFPDEHPPESNNLEKGLNETDGFFDFFLFNELGHLIQNQFNSNPDEISVFVAYTSAVDNIVVDPNGLIELAIKETNESYRNSNITAKVLLVGTKKVEYLESGNSFKTTLDHLSNKIDGFMDEVHSLRDSSKADIVVLLINNSNYCGLADAILADENSAFAVVFHECATGYYSFGHEIGHLQGARHNPEVDNATSPFEYGHGYYLVNDRVRTVMSYNCPGGCKRLPYWSNPQINYNGKSMGIAGKHNNSQVLEDTLSNLSGFR